MHNRFKFIKSLNVDQYVEQRLSDLLKRVVEGSNEVYRTPLAKGKDQSELLSMFQNRFIDKLQNLNDVLFKLEESNLNKFGPRSIAVPWEDRKENVNQYFSKPTNSISYSDLSLPKVGDTKQLRPLSLDKASSFLKNDTNSGMPFMRRKGILKERVLANFNEILERKDPCVLFTRTQEGLKTRTVWGFPMADTLNEMRFYRPLLEKQRKLSWRSALVGPNQVNQRLDYIVNSAVNNNLKLVSVDFSAYDSTVKQGLQSKCFDYIKSFYQYKYHVDIDYVAERFATIGIITPDGVKSGSHGVPSGSTFTNEVDSIAQYLIANHSGLVLDSLYDIQGDDGVYAINEDSVGDFFSNFQRFGLNVNIDKSYVSSEFCVYLQNLYHKDLKHNGKVCGIYPIARAFNRLIFQESWDDFEDYGISGSDYYSIRSISILENCKYHPLFKEFVQFIVELDKYNLQVSQKGITQYVEMMSSKLGTEGLFINQYGDDIKGIRNFETFKVISEINK